MRRKDRRRRRRRQRWEATRRALTPEGILDVLNTPYAAGALLLLIVGGLVLALMLS